MTDPEESLFGNRYVLGAQIGAGGMGAVFRATDRLNNEQVALKRLQADVVQAEQQISLRLALANEFQSLVALRHPHIINVRDYGFDAQKQPFFTMELIAQPRSFLNNSQFLDNEQKVERLLQLLSALAYVHRRGVIHRDLKPGNVLMTGHTVKLLDFGLATLQGKRERQAGSVGYLAPEILRGEPATAASDLFAVGILAYELLAGWHPFADTGNIAQTVASHRLQVDFSYVDAEPALISVLQRLLKIDPAERYSDANHVIQDLHVAIGKSVGAENRIIRESYLQSAPLTGRERELSRLTEALGNSLQKQGSSWLIGGESGIGKSRLLQEIRTQALVKGLVVLRGQAVSDGGTSYQLWRDALRHLVLIAPPNDFDAAILQQLIPDLSSLLQKPITSAPVLETQAAQTRLLLTVAELIDRAAQRQPLLILLEDLQWSDENSLQMLQWLMSQISSLPLLLLASYRQDESPHLSAQFAQMQHMQLERLGNDDIANLSAAILGSAGRQPHWLAFLQQQSEGNTFFMVEVMRALAEETGHLDRISQMVLPKQVVAGGILQLVHRRLARIADRSLPLLQQAAVGGRRLDLVVLHHLYPNIDLEAWLTECANAAILEVVDEGLRWQFNHDKVRESILSQLEDQKKRWLHQSIGEAIERVYGSASATYYGDLAWHFGEAGNLEKERSYLRAAANHAQTTFANSAAIDYYRRLLPLAQSPTDTTDTLMSMALLLKRMGEWEEAERLAQQGFAQSKLQERATSGRFAQIIGSLYTSRGNYTQALEWLQLARQLLSQSEAWYQLAETLNDLGVTYHTMGEYQEARIILNQNLQLASEQNHPEAYAIALQVLGRVTYEQGEYDASFDYFQQALQQLEKLGAKAQLASTMNNLGNLVRFRGRFDEAKTLYGNALTLFREIGDKVGISSGLNNLGLIAQEERDFALATELYEQTMQLKRALNDKRGIAIVNLNLASAFAEQGKLVEAAVLLEEALRLYRQLNNRLGIATSLYNLGEIAARLGEYASAYGYYVEGLELLQQVGDKQIIAYCIISIASLVLLDQTNPAQTILLLSIANHILHENQLEAQADVRTLYQKTLDAASAQIDPKERQNLWQAGQHLDLEMAIHKAILSKPPGKNTVIS